MAELLQDHDVASVEEANNYETIHGGDDSESLDSDGYDKNDPYASMAKKIDQRNKVEEEFQNRPLIRASNKIIENRANMTYFEKNMKYIVLVALLAYLVMTNLGNLDETRATQTGSSGLNPFLLFDWRVYADMSNELCMLIFSVGGYCIMARYNMYLD